ncbi:MAG: stress response protein [Solirubrobacterales bacterium]|nr:stress response protein [Solirubrobacterales bacterium]
MPEGEAKVGAGEPMDDWHPARLIPTVGIRGQEEQERRATSCLLAVMHAVPEFGHALLKELGAPKSTVIKTFAEVRFRDRDGKTIIPDGAIVCERAGRRWICLVEVKTGKAPLKDGQVSSYLDVARDNDFDGVLTISNQITASSGESPVTVDGRKLKRTSLWHFSWWRIITEAIVQSRYRGVADPDQAWLLGELIAYFDSEVSGTGGFQDMGDQWVSVRTAAHDNTLRASDPNAHVVAERWEEFSQYLCLGLAQDLGRSVTLPRPRKQSRAARLDELAKLLATDGVLEATLRVPDAVGDLTVRCDLRARQTLTSVTIKAPGEGRAKSRINWLIRQLSEAPGDLRIEAVYPNARETTGALLGQARDDVDCLIYRADPKREPRAFNVTLSRPMGKKRGKAEGSFVRETRTQTFAFYRDFIQDLKAWQARAPKLREEPESGSESSIPSPDPPPAGAPESREPGEAPDPFASLDSQPFAG